MYCKGGIGLAHAHLFSDMIGAMWEQGRYVCVGLDPDTTNSKFARAVQAFSELPPEQMFHLNCSVVEATCDVAGCFKPNAAFYERHGSAGLQALGQTVKYIRKVAPGTPIILDAKRGDIGRTNDGYVEAYLDLLGFDAITVHGYLGQESLGPFLARTDKGIIVMGLTSNPGAKEFQGLPLESGDPLYLHVAKQVATKWNTGGNCWIVVGATFPEEAGQIRQAVGDGLPFLVPGVGTQGGEADKVVPQVVYSAGAGGFVINSSSGIMFASGGPDRVEASRCEALKLHGEIRAALGLAA